MLSQHNLSMISREEKVFSSHQSREIRKRFQRTKMRNKQKTDATELMISGTGLE